MLQPLFLCQVIQKDYGANEPSWSSAFPVVSSGGCLQSQLAFLLERPQGAGQDGGVVLGDVIVAGTLDFGEAH